MENTTPRVVQASEAVTGIGNDGIWTPDPRSATKPGRVVVTGASTGIGWATVETLRAAGWKVVAVARRAERLAALAASSGCEAFAADLSDPVHTCALADFVSETGGAQAIVNNAGGALGSDPVATGDLSQWRAMYERNVMTSLNVTQAFLPSLREHGGDLVFITSLAALETYPGGAGYTAAKHAQSMLPATLRLELVGEAVRISEVCPGLVQTPEFALNRLGDQKAAEKVYDKVNEPLVAQDVADAIAWILSRPAHVNIDRLVIKPVEQATAMISKAKA
ncbi:MAG: SDR family oxidoreductase [Actinomycetaceae bacterium]|nr:SDR family oxidoreductase [Actinomycetaceae bacterium]